MACGSRGDGCDRRGQSHGGPECLGRDGLRPMQRSGSSYYSRIGPTLLRYRFQPRSAAPGPWPAGGGGRRDCDLRHRGCCFIQAVPQPNGTDAYHLVALVRLRRRRYRRCCTAGDWAGCRRAGAAAAPRIPRRHLGSRGACHDDRDYHFAAPGALGDRGTGRAAVSNVVMACRPLSTGLRRGRGVHGVLYNRLDDNSRHRSFRRHRSSDRRPYPASPGGHSGCDARCIRSCCSVFRAEGQRGTPRTLKHAAGART